MPYDSSVTVIAYVDPSQMHLNTLCSRIEDPCLLLINSKKFHRVALILACLLLNNWQNFLHVFKFSVSIIKTHLYVAIYVAYLVLTCISITLAAAFVQLQRKIGSNYLLYMGKPYSIESAN